MAINIYKDELTFAQLFYRNVLFTDMDKTTKIIERSC